MKPQHALQENMPQLDAVKIVESFWADVCAVRNPDAIDRYVVDDFVITSGGVDIRTRDSFKQWVREFQSKILDLKFETIESFQNADGSRVASRWRVRGRNNACSAFRPTVGRSSSPERQSGPWVPTASYCTTGSNAARGRLISV